MKTRTAKTSPLLIARLTGFLYLLVVPLGIFGSLYVPSKLIVSGDAAITADNLMASESLFRLGIVSDLLAALVLILVVLFLYKRVRPVRTDAAVVPDSFRKSGTSHFTGSADETILLNWVSVASDGIGAG